MTKFISAIVALIMICVGGCGDSGGSWIHGKWDGEVMGMKMEMDFRPNGELWRRGLGGNFFGKEEEPSENAEKIGAWSLKGNILTINEPGKDTREAVITKTDNGFMMMPAGAPIAVSFKRSQ